MSDVYAPFVTIPAGRPELQTFARAINAQSIPIQVKISAELRPLGNCYWNVAAVVDSDGGAAEFGWLFTWVPDVLIEAMHHCVWRTPSGRLIDVTERYPPNTTWTHSTFLGDNSIPVELTRLPYVQSHHHIISDIGPVRDFVEIYRRKNSWERQYSDLLWECGYRCENQFATAAGEKPEPANLYLSPAHQISYSQITAELSRVTDDLGAAILSLREANRK